MSKSIRKMRGIQKWHPRHLVHHIYIDKLGISMNRHGGHFDHVFKKVKESEKILKKWNPLAWSPFMFTSC